MSWSFQASGNSRAEFIDNVIDAEVTGQSLNLPGVNDVICEVKDALIALSYQIYRPKITASATGHSPQIGEGDCFEGVSINISGSN